MEATAAVSSASSSSSSSTAVVFAFVHGNNGSGDDWCHLQQSLLSNTWIGHNKHVFFFSSRTSEGKKTFVGVEALAHRLVEEMTSFFSGHSELASYEKWALYLISHSLGGLITRCALPQILDRFVKVIPFGWMSIASPHLGVCRPGGDFLKNSWKFLTERACEKHYNQTGLDLILLDKDGLETERSILARMADPSLAFAQSLKQVKEDLFVVFFFFFFFVFVVLVVFVPFLFLAFVVFVVFCSVYSSWSCFP